MRQAEGSGEGGGEAKDRRRKEEEKCGKMSRKEGRYEGERTW